MLTLKNALGSEPCGKRNYHVCKFYIKTVTFSPVTTDETFKINKGPLNCNFNNVNLLGCKDYTNMHVGEAQIKYRLRLSNY